MTAKTLIVLTLDEIDGVKAIMPQIDRNQFEQILILDGNSTDGTIEWCREQGYEVYVQKKRGIRFAYIEALPLIRGEIVLTISPDGNCDPAMIPEILRKMDEGYDLVIGSRYLPPAKSEDDDIVTAFGNWLFTRTVNILHRAKYTDCMVIYRAFRLSIVRELDLDREESYRLPEFLFGTVISWEPLMSVRAAKAKKRIAEVAAGEPPRLGGVRKLQILRWGAAYYLQFLIETLFWSTDPSHCKSIAGRLRKLPTPRTFQNGQLFARVTVEVAGGAPVEVRKIFTGPKLLPYLRSGESLELFFWNRQLYGLRLPDGTVVEDIANARRMYFLSDWPILAIMACTIVLLPVTLAVAMKRLRRSGSSIAMWHFLNVQGR